MLRTSILRDLLRRDEDGKVILEELLAIEHASLKGVLISHRLHLGDINFPPPINFIEALHETTDGLPGTLPEELRNIGKSHHQYMIDEAGLEELRLLIIKLWLEPLGVQGLVANNIIVTTGAQSANDLAIKALVGPRERILLLKPFYPYHWNAAYVASGSYKDCVIEVESSFADGFRPDLGAVEQALEVAFRQEKSGDKGPVKAIVFSSPNNPSGKCYSRSDVQELVSLARLYNIALVSDETYALLGRDNAASSLSAGSTPEFQERGIITGTFSKVYGVTGWRYGFLAIPDTDCAKLMAKFSDSSHIHTPTFAQIVLWNALKKESLSRRPFSHLDGTSGWINELRQRHRAVYEVLVEFRDAGLVLPGNSDLVHQEFTGAYYMFPRIEGHLAEKLENYDLGDEDPWRELRVDWKKKAISRKMELFLLKEAKLTCTSGYHFGLDNHVRFAYGAALGSNEEKKQAQENLREALGRLLH